MRILYFLSLILICYPQWNCLFSCLSGWGFNQLTWIRKCYQSREWAQHRFWANCPFFKFKHSWTAEPVREVPSGGREGWREGVIPASDSQIVLVCAAPSGHVTVGMHTHASRCLCKCLRGNSVWMQDCAVAEHGQPRLIRPAMPPSLGRRC